MKGKVMNTELYRGKPFSMIKVDDPRFEEPHSVNTSYIWVEGAFTLGLEAEITILFEEG